MEGLSLAKVRNLRKAYGLLSFDQAGSGAGNLVLEQLDCVIVTLAGEPHQVRPGHILPLNLDDVAALGATSILPMVAYRELSSLLPSLP